MTNHEKQLHDCKFILLAKRCDLIEVHLKGVEGESLDEYGCDGRREARVRHHRDPRYRHHRPCSLSQSFCQSVRLYVRQYVRQSSCQSVIQPVIQSFMQPVSPSIRKSVGQSIRRSESQSPTQFIILSGSPSVRPTIILSGW